MPVTIDIDEDIAVVTVDNPPVNALSHAVRAGLWEAAETLDRRDDLRAVVLAAAGRTFPAGADVREFGQPPAAPALPDLIDRIEAARLPWIAALHGTALGGGLELALGCRVRIADPDTRLGLPEVSLGLIPGAGGTVRLPRLVGMEAAARMIAGGRPVDAATASATGLVDRIADGPPADAAIAHARRMDPPGPLSSRPVRDPLSEEGWAALEAEFARAARGASAPGRALAHLRTSQDATAADARAAERALFLELRDSAESAALRHVFFAERGGARPAALSEVTPRTLSTAGVVGGGTMGSGIAAALLSAGMSVTLVERDATARDRAAAAVEAILARDHERGRIDADTLAARRGAFRAETALAAVADADIVIEAIFEDIDAKRALFADLGRICRADTILATNTSYLDPGRIGAAAAHPERVTGMHFFSPAHVMKLLEIVPTPATTPQVRADVFALAKRLGKVAVEAGIAEGFIGNRIFRAYRTEAERLTVEGADPWDVDARMRRFGMAMGPFEVQDLAGLDIAAAQRKAARARGETPFAPVSDRLVEAGRLGRKSGAGWYDYDGGRAVPSAAVSEILAGLRDGGGTAPDEAAIADRLAGIMADTGATLLEEGIARQPSDIDLVMIHGYGFPRWRGGPMHWAEASGLAHVAASLGTRPGPAFARAAAAGGFR